MSAGELAAHLGLNGAAVSALIDRLEAAGYVARARGTHDRRRVTVHAKPDRLHEIDALYERQRARMNRLLARYSARDFWVISDFLEYTTRVLTEEARTLIDGGSQGAAQLTRQ
jgi:DNA-binding MarR family transcriptional regulator